MIGYADDVRWRSGNHEAFYWRMLDDLPRDIAEKIAYRNGLAMFGLQ